MNSKDFLKYLKKIDFPTKKYDAVKSYPGTEYINRKFINDFNEKYKKKFLYDHDKDISDDTEANKLFNESLKYISKIQENLNNINVENYIAGGGALKLYGLKCNINVNKKMLTTKDFDIYIFLNEKKIKSIDIYNNSLNIINSILKYPNNPNFGFLETYLLVHFENTKKFKELIDFYIGNGFDLHLYTPKEEINTYIFKFVKVINNEFCIRFKIKFQKIDDFIKNNIYSYSKITYYYIKRIGNKEFKPINKFIPIEFLVKNRNKSNIDIMKSSLDLNNKFYLYNQNTLLYNLLHLYYKYRHNIVNKTIKAKKLEEKNKRDEERLNYFFDIYCCNIKHLLNSKFNIKQKLIDLKNDEKKFIKDIEKIKDFKMIEKHLIKK
jgi:hypothetical protein